MVLAIPLLAWTHVGKENVVDVRIVADNGSEFSKHRVYPRCQQEGNFFYVEAVKGDRYSIQVTNKSGRRVGVVIAVDGRNIISAKKSDLKRNERMYIIGPHETNIFEGWRTAMDTTNRFYFTEQSDSYAEKVFGDASAMGTIALAVYKEKIPEIVPYSEKPSRMNDSSAGAAPSEYRTAEKIVLKYEWRSELCRKGIISCDPKNRFWPDDQEFAPIPKDFKG
jgi:hypothetical protein